MALEVRSQELGKKKILRAPKVTFFMNLKERNREFEVSEIHNTRSDRAVEIEPRTTLYKLPAIRGF